MRYLSGVLLRCNDRNLYIISVHLREYNNAHRYQTYNTENQQHNSGSQGKQLMFKTPGQRSTVNILYFGDRAVLFRLHLVEQCTGRSRNNRHSHNQRRHEAERDGHTHRYEQFVYRAGCEDHREKDADRRDRRRRDGAGNLFCSLNSGSGSGHSVSPQSENVFNYYDRVVDKHTYAQRQTG